MSTRTDAPRGSTVTLKAEFTRSGVGLFDPFSVDGVTIRDPSGTLMATIAAGAITNEQIGIYSITYDVPLDADDGLWTDTWAFVPDSGDAQQLAALKFAVTLVATTPAVSPDTLWMELETYRGRLHENTVVSDEDLAEAARTAQEIIEITTGKQFTPTAETILLDGPGKPVIFLPAGKRLQSVTSIEAIDPDGDVDALDLATLKVTPTYLVFGDYQGGEPGCIPDRCDESGTGAYFPLGEKNIRLSGVFGDYATLPRTIRMAAELLTARLVEQPLPFVAAESESVAGDFSVTYRKVVDGARLSGTTGWGDIDNMLGLFHSRKIRIGVV